MTKSLLSLALVAIAWVLSGVSVQAQPVRAFVALTGSDANPCTFVSPCKSAQHAHDIVAPGGEVRMLDPGSYGLLTITKAVSILGDGHGGLAACCGLTAVTINAGAGDRINLRGLVIEGFFGGGSGIQLNSAGFLDIQDCIIRDFNGNGMNFSPSSILGISMTNSTVSANFGQGIELQPVASSGTINVSLDRVTLASNGGNGLDVTGTFVAINVSVYNSAIANNGGGIRSQSDGPPAAVTVHHSEIAGNGIGLQAAGATGTVRFTKSTITGNGTGISGVSGGTLESFGDNALRGNTTDGVPTATVTLK